MDRIPSPFPTPVRGGGRGGVGEISLGERMISLFTQPLTHDIILIIPNQV